MNGFSDNKDNDMPPELRAMVEKKQKEILAHNQAPMDDFAGLSPAQMYALVNQPWDSPETPVQAQLTTMEMVEASLLCRGMLVALQYFSPDKGEKLTLQGRWPKKLLMQIFELGDAGSLIPGRPPRLEEDSPLARALHVILYQGGLLRKAKGRMLTTQKGKQLMTMPVNACEWIEHQYTERFNWAYLDGFPEAVRYQQHWGYLVWLLLKYGEEERPLSFYVDCYLKAWPMFLDELPEDQLGRAPEGIFQSIFEVRYIRRGFAWLGWVDYRQEGRGLDATIMLRATPAFYQRWATASLHG